MTGFKFSFSSAFLHFLRTDGPGGFIWKFVLVYVLSYALMIALGIVTAGPLLDVLVQTDFDPSEAEVRDLILPKAAGLIGVLLLSMPLGALLWVLLECAGQRRYMRGEGFSLRFSADEGRMFLVGLIWIGMTMVLQIGMSIVQLIFSGVSFAFSAGAGDPGAASAIAAFLVLIGTLVTYLLQYYFMIRWSAASALTIRDQQIRFFESWALTRGRVLPMGLAYLVLWLTLGLVATIVFLIVGGASLYPAIAPFLGGGEPEPREVFEALFQPGVMTGLGVAVLLSGMISSVMNFAMMGIPAAAAKDDPRAPESQVDQVFS